MCLFKKHKKTSYVIIYDINDILDIMNDICIDKELKLDTKVKLLKLFNKLIEKDL